jgi:hypothetical protein
LLIHQQLLIINHHLKEQIEAHDALANDDWALVGTSDLEENNVKSPLLFNEVYKKSSTDEQRQAPLNKTSKNNIG